MIINRIPLEDELGDVLDKALRHAGLTEAEAGLRAQVNASKLRDAIDYRYDLRDDEIRRLAGVLKLNEVGLTALAHGQYPLPEIVALPFCVWPLRMEYGIGVVNAYVVGECGDSRGLLFDVGPSLNALAMAWPRNIKDVAAVFLTHVEQEHAGGLCEVVDRFDTPVAYVPKGARAACSTSIGEGETKKFGPFSVAAFTTPGHSAAHNCYLVTAPGVGGSSSLLVTGDLIFAGSAGGGYFCHRQLQAHVRRVLESVPPNTVIAPGHGPLTTATNELRFNPFVV